MKSKEDSVKVCTVRVAARVRPFMEGENNTFTLCHFGEKTLTIKEPKQRLDESEYFESHEFSFSKHYGMEVQNQQVYNDLLKDDVALMFRGVKNSACFAFGQTGSGKTYTILGKRGEPDEPGFVQLALNDIFLKMNASAAAGVTSTSLTLRTSLFEIYNSKIYDLLNGKNVVKALENLSGNIVIKDLLQLPINSYEQGCAVLEQALSDRVTRANATNEESSRSHAVLRLDLLQNDKLHGSLCLVDLAGAEKASVSQTSKSTHGEGAEINTSLLALKECIRAIDSGRDHIPFRNSILTKVLRHCFSPDAKTTMIANVSPFSNHVDCTLNTLRYAELVSVFNTERQVSSEAIKNPGKAMKQTLTMSRMRGGYAINAAASERVSSETQKKSKSTRHSVFSSIGATSAVGKVEKSQKHRRATVDPSSSRVPKPHIEKGPESNKIHTSSTLDTIDDEVKSMRSVKFANVQEEMKESRFERLDSAKTEPIPTGLIESENLDVAAESALMSTLSAEIRTLRTPKLKEGTKLLNQNEKLTFQMPSQPTKETALTYIEKLPNVSSMNLEEENLERLTDLHEDMLQVTKDQLIKLCAQHKEFLLVNCAQVKDTSSDLKEFTLGRKVTSDYIANIRNMLSTVLNEVTTMSEQLSLVENLVLGESVLLDKCHAYEALEEKASIEQPKAKVQSIFT